MEIDGGGGGHFGLFAAAERLVPKAQAAKVAEKVVELRVKSWSPLVSSILGFHFKIDLKSLVCVPGVPQDGAG